LLRVNELAFPFPLKQIMSLIATKKATVYLTVASKT
jgi:hypothetical protein